MTDTDAITALRQAAEEAGWGFELVDHHDPTAVKFRLWSSHDSWDFVGYAAHDIPAAHALIAWWKRRGWVPCPGCQGLGVSGFAVCGCETCEPHGGKGRVPPDG